MASSNMAHVKTVPTTKEAAEAICHPLDLEATRTGSDPRRSKSEHDLRTPKKELGWKNTTIVLITEAIAVGAMSLPKAFHVLGMGPAIVICIICAAFSGYGGILCGAVKLKYPAVRHYADATALMGGDSPFWTRALWWGLSVGLFLKTTFLVAAHVLIGQIALDFIAKDVELCALVWGFIAMLLLLLAAVPPRFHDFSWLGYVDFASIVGALLITIIATGIQSNAGESLLPGSEPWSWYPKPGVTIFEVFLWISNICFAFTFSMIVFTVMNEMHTPEDYVYSVSTLMIVQTCFYCIVGGTVYAFVGSAVEAPSLESAGSLVSRIAFGVALPVIIISGSLNTIVISHYALDAFLPNSPIRKVNTITGWMVWLSMVTALSIFAYIIAEAIPFFAPLVSLISSLFGSGFSFYLPGLMWFFVLREGEWTQCNIILGLINVVLIMWGLAVLVLGTYASIHSIMDLGNRRGVFTCKNA